MVIFDTYFLAAAILAFAAWCYIKSATYQAQRHAQRAARRQTAADRRFARKHRTSR